MDIQMTTAEKRVNQDGEMESLGLLDLCDKETGRGMSSDAIEWHRNS